MAIIPFTSFVIYIRICISINYNGIHSDKSMANTEGHGCKSKTKTKKKKKENGNVNRNDDDDADNSKLQSKMTM